MQQSDTHCTIQCTKYVRCAIVLFALSVLVLGSDLDPIAVFCPLQGFTPSINVLFGGTAPALSRLIGPRYPRVSPLHFLEMHPSFRRRAVKMFRLFTTGRSHESVGQPPCTRLDYGHKRICADCLTLCAKVWQFGRLPSRNLT